MGYTKGNRLVNEEIGFLKLDHKRKDQMSYFFYQVCLKKFFYNFFKINTIHMSAH